MFHRASLCSLLVAGLLGSSAAAVSPRQGPQPHPIQVHRRFPVVRDHPDVKTHRPGVVVRVSPRVYLPLVFWQGVVLVAPYPTDRLQWRDSETLSQVEGWTETVFDVNRSGSVLVMTVRGEATLGWVEVVFDDGEAQVVDFQNQLTEPGRYVAAEFGGRRHVDHVRLLASAAAPRTVVDFRLVR